MRKKKSRKVSATPFTDWVKAGAKEEDWEKYLSQVEWRPGKEWIKENKCLAKLFLKEGEELWDSYVLIPKVICKLPKGDC